MMKKISTFLLCLSTIASFGQSNNSELPTSINEDGSTPHSSAILDVDSNSKGILIPRLTQSEVNAMPNPKEESLLIYNTSLNRYQFWNGTKFIDISPRETILDFDNDTKVSVEQTTDEDVIHFDIAGDEKMALLENSNGRTLLQLFDDDRNLHIGNNVATNTSGSNNTYLGDNAGRYNSTGGFNVGVGAFALRDNSTHANNVALGYLSLSNNENNANTAIGSRSGAANTTGQRNTFLGWNSGNKNISGSHNTYLGQESGLRNTTGSHNTYLGSFAGADGNGGSYNTYLGYSSGRKYSGGNNVFIGKDVGTGSVDPGSNKLMIDNSNTNTPLIYGDFQNDVLTINGVLSVNDKYRLPTSDGSANQILQTDGLGNVSWANASSGGGSTWSNSGSDIYYNSGDVGIGTSSPQASLDVNGSIIIGNDGAAGQEGMVRYFGTDLQGFVAGSWESLTDSGGSGGSDSDWTFGDFGIHNLNDNVGIGSNESDVQQLRVISDDATGTYIENLNNFSTSGTFTPSPATYGLHIENKTTTNSNIPGIRYGVFSEVTGTNSGRPYAVAGRVHEQFGRAIYGHSTINTGWAGYFEGNTQTAGFARILDFNHLSEINMEPSGHENAASIRLSDRDEDVTVEIYGQNNGNTGGWIGLNKQDGSKTIELDANRNQGGEITVFNENEVKRIELIANEGISNNGAQILLWGSSSTTGNNSDAKIELDADYGDGDSRIITDELEIRGGSDLAEHFDIVTENNHSLVPEAGMIVSIDPNSTGKLIVTTEACDKKVAGVISGAHGVKPGMLMGQKGTIADGEYPIALTGRVYVKANVEGGIIKPGDLLTSSSDAGIAMKVKDYTTAQGAIIGKAMTEVDADGFVLVLVNLQ